MYITIIHKERGKWYFYNETWTHRAGPFDTEQEATEKFEIYCKEHLREETE